MQNLMRFMAVRRAEILVVQPLDRAVLMRFAKIHILVGCIEHSRALCAQIDCVAHLSRLRGLPAAVDAAARAGHDFDKIDLFLARFHRAQQTLGIGPSRWRPRL